VSSTDEQALRQRLRQELGALPAPAAPVAAVLRRGAARRARRWAAAASGLAAVTVVAVSVPLLASHGQPAGRPGHTVSSGHTGYSGHTGSSGSTGRAGQVTGGGPAAGPPVPAPLRTTFAAGIAAGQPWQLSVRNIAGPGARCLPAIMLNATDGYLPPTGPGVAGGLASLAFLTNVPGQPAAGFAALRVSPEVTRLTVGLRDGQTLAVRPVTVQACGLRLPLAGFSYPRSGVAAITAYAGPQVVTRVTPPASLFTGTAPGGSYVPPGTPSSAGATLRLVPGVWQQLWRTPDAVASGLVASGRLAGAQWRISVQLGAAGDCFLSTTFDGQVAARAADCVPITLPPATVTLQRFVIQQHTGLTGYAGLASPRTSYLVARLSDGRSVRVNATQVGGRRYVALALPAGRTVTRVTAYDRAGLALGIVSLSTAGS
jgi:hypothetical protein